MDRTSSMNCTEERKAKFLRQPDARRNALIRMVSLMLFGWRVFRSRFAAKLQPALSTATLGKTDRRERYASAESIRVSQPPHREP
jgi:hypothetical protein